MKTIADVKKVFYKILLLALDENSGDGDNGKNTFIDQKFELIMKGMQRNDGINVINIQNVQLSKIGKIVIEGLCLIDELCGHPGVLKSLVSYEVDSPVLIEFDRKKPIEKKDIDPVSDFINFCFDQRIKWKDLQVLVKTKYRDKVLREIPSTSRAAKFLELQEAYWISMKNKNFDKINIWNPKHRGNQNEKRNLNSDKSFRILRTG